MHVSVQIGPSPQQVIGFVRRAIRPRPTIDTAYAISRGVIREQQSFGRRIRLSNGNEYDVYLDKNSQWWIKWSDQSDDRYHTTDNEHVEKLLRLDRLRERNENGC